MAKIWRSPRCLPVNRISTSARSLRCAAASALSDPPPAAPCSPPRKSRHLFRNSVMCESVQWCSLRDTRVYAVQALEKMLNRRVQPQKKNAR